MTKPAQTIADLSGCVSEAERLAQSAKQRCSTCRSGRDRARDLDLRGLGYGVLRLTYVQVKEEPGRVAAAIRDAVAS